MPMCSDKLVPISKLLPKGDGKEVSWEGSALNSKRAMAAWGTVLRRTLRPHLEAFGKNATVS